MIFSLAKMRAARWLLAGTIMLSAHAHADIWGYVDAGGVSHFAPQKIDERYQLFLKGGIMVEPPDPAIAAAAQTREAFERTPVFLRTTGHPNFMRYQTLIEQHARMQKLDPALVKAVIAVESGFQPEALSPKGALGLMQIIPGTGERYGVAADKKRSLEQKLLDPAINLGVGTRYLRDLLALFSNNTTLALAAYNAGEGAVQRHDNRVPPYAETEEYVKLVHQFYSAFRPPAPTAQARIRVVIPGQRNRQAAPLNFTQ